ncbi:hypothetical protein phiA047_0177 [Aeromonas phage phiA047]|nr:hypothetical protein phiA047_0177 [Aeromonas phage phiA047]
MAIISKTHNKIMANLKTVKVGSFVFIPYAQGFKGKVVNMKNGQYHVQIKNSKGLTEVRKYYPETVQDMTTNINEYLLK